MPRFQKQTSWADDNAFFKGSAGEETWSNWQDATKRMYSSGWKGSSIALACLGIFLWIFLSGSSHAEKPQKERLKSKPLPGHDVLCAWREIAEVLEYACQSPGINRRQLYCLQVTAWKGSQSKAKAFWTPARWWAKGHREARASKRPHHLCRAEFGARAAQPCRRGFTKKLNRHFEGWNVKVGLQKNCRTVFLQDFVVFVR